MLPSRGSSQHRITPGSLALQVDSLPSEPPGKPHVSSPTQKCHKLSGGPSCDPAFALGCVASRKLPEEFVLALILAGGRDSDCLSHILIWFLAALLGLGRWLRSQSLGRPVWVAAVMSTGRREPQRSDQCPPLPLTLKLPCPQSGPRKASAAWFCRLFCLLYHLGRTSIANTHNCTISQTPAMLNPPTEWLPITHHLQFRLLIKLFSTICYDKF